MPKYILVQTTVPDYRVPVFELLASVFHVRVLAGEDFYTGKMPNAAVGRDWMTKVTNVFMFRRKFLVQLGIFFESISADAVLIEWNPRNLSLWPILVVRSLLGRRTVVWGHVKSEGGDSSLGARLKRMMLRLSEGLICYTHSDSRLASDRFKSVNIWVAANSCVNSVDCVSSSISGTGANVVWVGRMIPKKKVLIAIRAWSVVLRSGVACGNLVIVGNGPDMDKAVELVAELKLVDRVEFTGHVSPGPELNRIYDGALVALSTGYVGLSCIQAMARGVPMLISRTEDHSPEIEACSEGLNCEYFKTDSEEDLASRTIAFFEAHQVWNARRAAIANSVRESYTIESMVKELGYAFIGRKI